MVLDASTGLSGGRLARAGIDATVDVYPGTHTNRDKIDEIVGYLWAAAGWGD